MSLEPFIRDLAIILAVASLVSLLFQKIRQPVVLGYIVAGMIVGPYTPPYPLITDTEGVKVWAELGIIFLMFSLGLEFSFRKLASVGISAGFTAIFEVIFMLLIGFSCGRSLGWSSMDSFFLGAMLSISSTTVIIKALDELKFKNHRFAELIFGILIVEDLVAILILVALSNIALHQAISGFALLVAAYKLTLVVGSWFVTGYFIVPRFIRYVGRVGNNEMLTIVSLGLCLALVVFSSYFEYSVALGAFIMGSILAESNESRRIEHRMEALRDLFAAIFFVSVGMLINPRALGTHFGSIMIITGVTIIGKIISTTLATFITGQTLKTSIQVGFGIAQIGEFSFIIAGLGLSLGVVSEELYPIGVAVSLITTFTTPYLIRFSYPAATWVENQLPAQVKSGMSLYARWIQKQQADVQKSHEFYHKLFKWLINALIVSVLFILSGEFLLPWVEEVLPNPIWPSVLSWVMTVSISTPFIWAMLSIFENHQSTEGRKFFPSTPSAGISLLSQLLALIWVGALSLEFFETKIVIVIIALLAILVLTVFYKRIELTYRWFERRFISTFEAKENTPVATAEFSHLAPWDDHLVRFKVHPNAPLVGVRLIDAKLRSQFGVSVVVIQRGLKAIIAPKPEEMILPQDELLVLGNDHQMDSIRSQIEGPLSSEENSNAIEAYDLRRILIAEHSSIMNQTIRESKVREEYGAMVVGIERNDDRIINPESTEKIQKGDTLWIVGEKSQLDRITVAFSS